MLNARVFAPSLARIFACVLISAAAIAVAASFATRVQACPDEEPQPLRLLYLKSDRIVVARVGKTETVKVEKISDVDEQETLSELKTELLVSSTLKGEHEPVVYLYHTIYRDFQDSLGNVADGNTLLVFLNHVSEEGADGYYINDMNYGLKTLSEADLKVYTRRIEELDAIMQTETPNDAEILEWIVRCTEDPVTRWEGSYDLVMSNYSLASVRERQADAANPDNVVAEPDYSEQAVVNDAEPVSPEEAREIEQERFYDREGKYITSLTADQKNRLMLVLLNTQTIEDKDFPLIQVAKDWDDPRYVPFLLTQLRAITDASSYQVTILMTIVADKLDDASLKDLATEYRDNLYSNEMESNDESEAVESGSAEQTNTDEQRVVPASPAELKRQAKLQYFIALAESVVPKADADNALNASASEKP